MSKRINVNPDHYKVAGRERQGEDVVHPLEKREIKRLGREEKRPPRQRTPIEAQRVSQPPAERRGRIARAGISNRQPAEAESREREEVPPVDTSSPPPQDAAGRIGEQPLDDRRDRQTSHKAGSRSIAQNEAGARYPDRSMPASRKVAGASGREPQTGPAGERTTRPPKRTRRR